MQRTWATHFDVVGTVEHIRENELGDLHGDRAAVFGLCAFDPMSLLFRLNGLFHRESAFANCRRRRKGARSRPWALPFQQVSSAVSLLTLIRLLPSARR